MEQQSYRKLIGECYLNATTLGPLWVFGRRGPKEENPRWQ
jgi:hypothetical protein